MNILVVTLIASLSIASLTSHAVIYPLPDKGKRLIGEPVTHQVKQGDYFQALAEQYNVGFLSLMAANPDIDPFLPEPDTQLNIPTQMLLPFVERKGLVINLPEFRLYYFQPESNVVHVFPIGIGRQGLETPITTTYIGEKKKNPIWRPTPEMKERYLKEKGVVLADEVPAGPNNPFGKYALRLATSVYLIHGTNQRFGIGARASSGCIRMFDDDIKWLYDNVPLNTQVKIIDQPIKMSYEKPGEKLIEMHQPLSSKKTEEQLTVYRNKLRRFIGAKAQQRYLDSFEQATGLVQKVK
ncbi:L,D-transpeptidase family protein [Thalassotalea sp. M1531]|uniref:L,D-transpeptidase family protein n=1 Tax=Thalassotalea algicola TaxID=2716224 RepID=A0A7Y0LDN6_9GAMM|nr:L,D-transpeptidase family protein [Thalassotalea algicola]NMP32247.1 L,D-transpeptidase family protein [Thalassotalea algicola]